MRELFRFLIPVLLIMGACGSASAIGPADLVDLTNPFLTPEDLALRIGFGAPGVSIVPGSVIYTGAFRAAGTFNNGLADGIGLQNGIVLTTGSVLNDPSGPVESVILGPNVFDVGTENLIAGDADLGALIGVLVDETFDTSALTFNFTSASDVITFLFVFGSEEYPDNIGNDVFGLFIDGVNVAVVPVTASPVSVFNLNGTVTPGLFNNNDPLFFGLPPFPTQLDGFSAVLAATATVTTSGEHTLKIAIADAGVDNLADSAVFIAGPFGFLADNIETLLTRFYNNILDRDPDPGGLDFWTSEIERIVSLDIDVKEGFQGLAKFFFDSAEYLLMGKDDNAFVTDLYMAFLNRAPEPAGLAFWMDQLAQGLTRDMLVIQFANSAEFNLLLQGFFGSSAARPESNLVNDFYRGFLNRFPDNGGFNLWLGQMRTAQCTGAQAVRDVSRQIALSFAHSEEYALRARNNSQYIEDLFNAFLRRGADPAGFNFWVTALNTQTRDQVLEAFIASPESQLRVDEVVNAGCLP